MKKLALASVAFAGITAFGAGDSFAAGLVGYTEANRSSFSFTDTTTWGPVGGQTVGTAGGTAHFSFKSDNKHIGGTANFGLGTSSNIPALTVFNEGTAVHGGFPANMHVLGDNSGRGNTGTISLAFSQGLSAIGFDLSPAGLDWGATMTAYSGTSGSYVKMSPPIGFTGAADCRALSGTAGPCSSPQFLGFTDSSTPITKVEVALKGTGILLIGQLEEQLSSTKAIPEPASLSVLGAGLLGLGALRKRRRSRDPAIEPRWSPFGRWRVAVGRPDPK
jgi:hypothetical protein